MSGDYVYVLKISVVSFFFISSLIFFESVFLHAKLFSRGNVDINTGVNGIFFAALIPFLIGIYCYVGEYRWKSLTVGTLFIVIWLVIDSQSRTAIISTLLSCLMFILIRTNLRLKKRNWKLWLKVVIVSGFIVSILICIFFIYRINTNSVSGRLLIYKISLKILGDNPLLGVGMGNFRKYYNLYQADYFNGKTFGAENLLARNIYYAFNDVLQFTIEMGLLRFIPLFLFFLFGVWKISHLIKISTNPILLGTASALLCLILCSQFSYPLHILSIQVLSLFFLSNIIFLSWRFGQSSRNNITQSVVMILVAGILFIKITYESILIYRCQIMWEKAALQSLNGNFSIAKKIYATCYDNLKEDPEFLLNYGMELAIDGDYKQSLNILTYAGFKVSDSELSLYTAFCNEHLKKYSEAEINYLRAVNMVPSSFTYKHYLLCFYINHGRTENIISTAKAISEQPIKVQSVDVYQIKKHAMILLNKIKQ
ncbi:O-antigen ligase family protein [Pedobacter psychrodurus]|nr:O-antigen ligase family protein [Pedobacter psychrodurus]